MVTMIALNGDICYDCTERSNAANTAMNNINNYNIKQQSTPQTNIKKNWKRTTFNRRWGGSEKESALHLSYYQSPFRKMPLKKSVCLQPVQHKIPSRKFLLSMSDTTSRL